MAKKTDTPYPAPKMGIPWELKCKFARGQLTTLFKGVLYLLHERFGAAIALEMAEDFWKYKDRIKNMANTLKDVFKIEGNDMETIMKWWDIWYEIAGMESTVLEQSKTFSRNKITKCPWKTESKDIADWDMIFSNIVYKTINPKATIEKLKGMCAGDSYCEFVSKIEE